jgi:hypothetical protein
VCYLSLTISYIKIIFLNHNVKYSYIHQDSMMIQVHLNSLCVIPYEYTRTISKFIHFGYPFDDNEASGQS